MIMPIPHKYINTPDDAYEAETSYYLHFQLVSALISLDHIYNCKYSDSDLFESKAQYYHYYTDHLLYSLGQIAERFRESNNPNSTNDYFVRRSANRINYGFDKNNYPILSNKAFRNTIEHIDEHNIEVIKKHDAVGGFNTIDENTPEERKDTLRNKRNNHTYTLDLLLKRLYIEREDTPLTMNLDDLKNELLDLKKKALRKILCKFNNCDKKRYCERLEKQPLNFFTVYNNYRNLSSFFSIQSAGMEAD